MHRRAPQDQQAGQRIGNGWRKDVQYAPRHTQGQLKTTKKMKRPGHRWKGGQRRGGILTLRGSTRIASMHIKPCTAVVHG